MSENRLDPTCCSPCSSPNIIGRRRLLALAATMALVPMWPWRSAHAIRVPANDPRVASQRVGITTDWGKLDCYVAGPSAGSASQRSGVVVAHDKLGPTPHFEDIARYLATEGFTALLPDYASRYGGTPSEAGPALEVVGMMKLPDMIADTETVTLWLQADGNARVGAIGFGLGGTTINTAITRLASLDAAATFYGHPPPLADVGKIKAPLLLNFAGRDEFIDREVPPFIDALNKAGVKYELYSYENTVRGFDDDSAPAHYSADAAKLAWSRTDQFLRAALAG
jgi:carboxymethylenebutenolidase